MTGKENIFLNGAILGMTKKEISSKLNEIVEFSGCERYIDTPVKRYSSGMKVRLAFAVAAFLEPDILVVDEVLAVGDAEFQKKAIGKMKDISSQGGRTVLFVSHDMNAIKSLCSRLVILKNGTIKFVGAVEQGIQNYLYTSENFNARTFIKNDIQIVSATIGVSSSSQEVIEVFKPLDIYVKLSFKKEIPSDFKMELFFNDLFGQPISTVSSWLNSMAITPKNSELNVHIKLLNGLSFNEGEYSISLRTFTSVTTDFEDVLQFSVINSKYTGYKFPLKPIHGKVYLPNTWEVK